MNPNYEAAYNHSAGSATMDSAGYGLAAFAAAFLIFILVLFLIIYVYMAICLMKIAKKTNTENAWFAWIPILNTILMIQIAQKPLWWVLLFFVPFVNIIFAILVWMEISKKLGKPEWLGILMIVPVANLVIPGYLAFSNSTMATPPAAPQPPVDPAPTV